MPSKLSLCSNAAAAQVVKWRRSSRHAATALAFCGAVLAASSPASAQVPGGQTADPENDPRRPAVSETVRPLLHAALLVSQAHKPEEAIAKFTLALTRAVEIGDKEGEADARYWTGRNDSDLARWKDSLLCFQRANDLYVQTGDKFGEAGSLLSIGRAYSNIGYRWEAQSSDNVKQSLLPNWALDLVVPAQSSDYVMRSLKLSIAIEDRLNEAGCYSELGWQSQSRSPDESIAWHVKAMTIYTEEKDIAGQTEEHFQIGRVYQRVGKYQQAMLELQQALTLFRQNGNQRGEGISIRYLADIYCYLGHLPLALEYFTQGVAADHAAHNQLSEAFGLASMARILSEQGKQAEAIVALARAAAINGAIGPTQQSVLVLQRRDCLESMAECYLDLHDPVHALTAVNGAEAIGGVNDRTRIIRARVLEQTGRDQEALALLQKTGDKLGAGSDMQIALAEQEAHLGRHGDAEKHLLRALREIEATRNAYAGLEDTQAHYFTRTLATYYLYIGLLLEDAAVGREARGAKTDRNSQLGEAFEWVQKTKARGLIDIMDGGKVNAAQNMSESERNGERDLRQRCDSLNAQMVRESVQDNTGSKARFADLGTQLTNAEEALRLFEDTLYLKHPGLAEKRATHTARLADVAAALPADTALLEYVNLAAGAKEKPRVGLLVVTRNASAPSGVDIHLASLKSDATFGPSGLIEAYRSACADPRRPYLAPGKALYAAVLEPATPLIAGKKRLIICPDGALWNVPFQALPYPEGGFLLDHYEVVYAYSASGALAALGAHGSARTRASLKAADKPAHERPLQESLLVMADPDFGGEARFGDLASALPGQPPLDATLRPLDAPSRPIDSPSRPIDSPSRTIQQIDAEVVVPRGGRISALPGTRREAESLRNDYPNATIYLGRDAQESRFKQEAGSYRFVHLASHAFLNDTSPLLSCVVLSAPAPGDSEDGFLTAREIFDMDLSNIEMTVLSACNTARGQEQSGEGEVGMTWALFAAGCPTQVVSQWSVDDACTATLMANFYAEIKAGKPKGVALHDAARSIASDGVAAHRHPYYWAPFVLFGDWN